MVERTWIALIGAGRHARAGLLPALQACNDVEVVAAMDPATCEW
jgi:hypothetical protein